MKNHFLRFNEYNNWANRGAFESIKNTAGVDSKAIELYSHIIIAQNIWLDRIAQQPISFDSPWIKLSLDECERHSQKIYKDWNNYLESIDEIKLVKSVEYKNFKGSSFENNLCDIITHVFNHSTYHRGQIAQLIRKSNGKPAATDFIAFARMENTST